VATGAERIEWIAGGVSALVVLGMIGFFVYEAVAGSDGPPRLEVSAEPVAGEGAHLRYRVRNSGGRPAVGVTLSLTLADGSRRSVIVDEVPPRSEVEGGMYLPEASGQEVELTVDGYVDP
jgi:uncharacterized protein (TIGR02588 family)